MTAIVLLSLPPDEEVAVKILDALVSERLDVRWFSAGPDGRDWEEAQQAAGEARCVLFCWSDATRTEAAAPFRELARAAIGEGTAVGIELHPGARPPDLAMTTYNLGGWRSADKGVLRWAVGKIFYNDIVAAAKFKAAGRDPAPPSAPAKLLARQLWVLAVGIGGVLGVLALPGEIYDKIPWPRFNEEAAWAALPADSCPALAEFRKQYPDGRYAGQARSIFENRQRGEARWTPIRRTAPFFVGAADAVPRAGEAAAKAEAETRIGAEAGKVCQGFSEAAGSKLVSATGKAESWQCTAIGGGTVCSVSGTAQCEVQELVEDAAEHCVLPDRK